MSFIEWLKSPAIGGLVPVSNGGALILGSSAVGVVGALAAAFTNRKQTIEKYDNKPAPTGLERIAKALRTKEVKKVMKLASGLGALGIVAALSGFLPETLDFGKWFREQDFERGPVIVPEGPIDWAAWARAQEPTAPTFFRREPVTREIVPTERPLPRRILEREPVFY